MSRTIASLVTGVVCALTCPLSHRQQLRVFARVIEKLQRRYPAEISTPRGTLKFMPLRGSFAASAIARFHSDEPETLAWIDGFAAGDVVWDVGANIGAYALYAALDRTLRVYAFEPSGFNFGLLVEHIALNQMGERVKPFCLALGNGIEIGELFMRYTDAGHGSNSLNSAANNFGAFEAVFRQAIPAFSIDQFRRTFRLPAPDHIKLDVDGLESAIIEGAAETLPSLKTLLIEIEGTTGTATEKDIETRVRAAGLVEDVALRTQGSRRNRLYRRRA